MTCERVLDPRSSPAQRVYVVGPHRTSKALADVLDVLLDCTVILIQSHSPAAIRHRMVRAKTSQFSRGEGTCIVDFSQDATQVPARCVQIINHLRNHEELQWIGALVVIARDDGVATRLSRKDLFGGTQGGTTAFGAFASSHCILTAPVRTAALLRALSSVDSLLPTEWEAAVAKGALQAVVLAWRTAKSAVTAKGLPCDSRVHELLSHVRRMDWPALIPLHGVPGRIRSAQQRLLCTQDATHMPADRVLRDVEALLTAAGVDVRSVDSLSVLAGEA